MTNVRHKYPSNSRYLKCTDLPAMQPITLTIKEYSDEMVGSDERPVIYFQGKEKGLVLTPTKWDPIIAAYGPESDGWVNKQVTIWHDPTVTFQGQTTGGIKLMVKAPSAAVAAADPAPAQEPQVQDEPPPYNDADFVPDDDF